MRKLVYVILSACALSAPDFVYGGGAMKVSSPDFNHGSFMPKKFTCDGSDVSPELIVEEIPQGAKSLVLVVDDPDAPAGTWVHWLVFDIPVTKKIGEGNIPGKQGANDFGGLDYGGPCPPSGAHRYFFRLYALDKELGLKEGVRKEELEQAMSGHILARAELIGLYKR